MSRRPRPSTDLLARAVQRYDRMAPGGTIASESPVSRPKSVAGGAVLVPDSPARQFRAVPGPAIVHARAGAYAELDGMRIRVRAWNSGLDPDAVDAVESDWPLVTITVTAPDAQTYTHSPIRAWGTASWTDASTGMTDPSGGALDWCGIWTVEAEAVWDDAHTLTDSWTFEVDQEIASTVGTEPSDTDYTWAVTEYLKDITTGSSPPPSDTFGADSWFFAEGDAVLSFAAATATWTVTQFSTYQRRSAWGGLIRRWTGRDGLAHGWSVEAVSATIFEWPPVTDGTHPPSEDYFALLLAELGEGTESTDPNDWEPAYDYANPPL